MSKISNIKNERDTTLSFTSADSASPTAWTNVDLLNSGEKHSSILNKISTMLQNVRYLYKMPGTTDISSIGDGSCTGAIASPDIFKDIVIAAHKHIRSPKGFSSAGEQQRYLV